MRYIALIALAGCGRIGFESAPTVDAPMVPVPVDVAPDAPSVCPADTVAISPGSTVCIELVQRGNLPWTDARADCVALGRRLCADAEWLAACNNAPAGLMEMVGPMYEWVAEESAGVAQKRGASSCDDPSAHAVIDPYDYRCCVDR